MKAAAHEFTMPAMSPTMTEGNIASWKVKEGTPSLQELSRVGSGMTLSARIEMLTSTAMKATLSPLAMFS